MHQHNWPQKTLHKSSYSLNCVEYRKFSKQAIYLLNDDIVQNNPQPLQICCAVNQPHSAPSM